MRAAAALVGFLLLIVPLHAHDADVAPVVEMTMRVQNGRLDLGLHLPAAVLGDAKLPRLGDGRLDEARAEGTLLIVGADAARNLDHYLYGHPKQ